LVHRVVTYGAQNETGAITEVASVLQGHLPRNKPMWFENSCQV